MHPAGGQDEVVPVAPARLEALEPRRGRSSIRRTFPRWRLRPGLSASKNVSVPLPSHHFFFVCAMKPPSCGVTFVPLHVGHFGFVFSRSEMVTVSSKGLLHFSQRNS